MIAALDFEHPFPFGTILVPPVRLAAGRLYFRPKGTLHPATGRPERLAFDFAGLSEAPEKAFLEFARKWGALGICPHRTTLHHRSPPCLHLVGDELAEPIAGWRGRARYVRSTLKIRSALNRGQPGSSADWRVVWPGSAPKERRVAAATLGLVASTFLSEMSAQPILQCVDQRLTIAFIGGKFPTLLKAMTGSKEIARWLSSSGTLLAEIAVRTALALQEGAGWAICSNPECRRLYRPRRHVAEGRLHFCSNCGKRASWRLSKRRRSAGGVHQVGRAARPRCEIVGKPMINQSQRTLSKSLLGKYPAR